MINPWEIHIPSNCSWLFRGMCKIADDIKAYLWMQSINPHTVSFLHDPCCFEMPIAFKPTFLNMQLDFESFSVTDFIQDNAWDINKFSTIFWSEVNPIVLSHGKIHPLDYSKWVWFSKTNNKTVIATIYSHYNSSHFT